MIESNYFASLSITKLSRVVRVCLLGGYLAFVLMVGFLLYMRPHMVLLGSLLSKERLSKQTLDSTSSTVLPYEKLQSELRALQKIESRLKEQLSSPARLPEVVKDLSALAEQNSLQISSIIQTGIEKANDRFNPELEIELYGEYRDLVAFFHFVSNAPSFIQFKSIDWTRRKGEGDGLRMKGTLTLCMGSFELDSKS
ncbi:type 4a pilus biogenesis protein PilO [Vibrio aquimaris]|uniref:Pilus assembly protein, PilO n=1 Tax=Vibrio aquimaris TaxID=2587862 RepID=A0A5P9CGS8_9VIBR|nr:type 4a pilus biogenesis protein PilO [Vibrio aquimaris]QFT25063.1 Pilus assembly protein, PilO [Vibrio aquimaris]